MRYRRLSDNQMVHDSEAVDGAGTLRSGYAMASNMLQPGQHIGFNMAFMDSAGRAPVSATHAAIAVTDAERTFLDSSAGRSAIAHARYVHDLSESHRGADAQPWNDAIEADAVRKLTADQTRLAATLVDQTRQAATLRNDADAAHKRMSDDLHNGWRK